MMMVWDPVAWLAYAMLAAGPLTLMLGMFLHCIPGIAAPYGRFAAHSSPLWGPLIPGRLAWVTQELPALVVPLLLAYNVEPAALPHPGSPCSALAAAFLLHYAYRSLLYPLRLKGAKGTALVVWAMALSFCCWNGFIQGWYLFHECPSSTNRTPGWRLHHVLGLSLWLTGWLLNLQCDSILRNLRTSPTDTGYHIPRGSLFEWVSAGNYTAECIEWAGWALAAWSLAPAAFALFTFSNLAPRAHAHHQWYQQKFKGQYPAARRAIIPLLW